METRFQNSPAETSRMNTAELRDNFLVEELMQPGKCRLVYSHYDRMIVGGIMPGSVPVVLPNEDELKAGYFLERREMGIINVGGNGTVTADGEAYPLEKLDCLYLAKGTCEVHFSSADEKDHACFYLLSAPAHHAFANTRMSRRDAVPLQLGDTLTSNKRSLYKYIHKDGIPSCQLVMGVTVLEKGSVWNSVPPHTHTRRMEVYFYFDVPGDHRVMHFMGEPQQTRHIVMANREVVISPPWSMHFGCGTSSYGFIWGMAGENMEFTDMDPAPVPTLQ